MTTGHSTGTGWARGNSAPLSTLGTAETPGTRSSSAAWCGRIPCQASSGSILQPSYGCSVPIAPPQRPPKHRGESPGTEETPLPAQPRPRSQHRHQLLLALSNLGAASAGWCVTSGPHPSPAIHILQAGCSGATRTGTGPSAEPQDASQLVCRLRRCRIPIPCHNRVLGFLLDASSRAGAVGISPEPPLGLHRPRSSDILWFILLIAVPSGNRAAGYNNKA